MWDRVVDQPWLARIVDQPLWRNGLDQSLSEAALDQVVTTFGSHTTNGPGVDDVFDRHAAAVGYYGSGKVAFRDGLAAFGTDGETVFLPAYLPDAVAEPVYELGLQPRYYPVRRTLEPDVAELEAAVDEDTAAIVTVEYFGFAQPGTAAIADLCESVDAVCVVDAAHAALSVSGGQLLATRGDVGFTSLRKLLAIPDGGALFLPSAHLARRFEPSSLCGPRERIRPDDLSAWSVTRLAAARDDGGALGSVLERVEETTGSAGSVPGPRDRYEASKSRLSWLSWELLTRTDPALVRARRRRNYRAWLAVLDGRPDVRPLYPDLPAGICPQSCPVYAEDPDRTLARLSTAGIRTAHTWPRLDRAVSADPTFETAQELSSHVVALPVHQCLSPDRIAAVDDRLSR